MIYDLVTEEENIRNHEIVDKFVENSLPEPGLSCTILFKTGGKKSLPKRSPDITIK